MRLNSASIQNWILPVAALAAWEILGRAGALPRYLSTPSAILAALWELALTGELFVAKNWKKPKPSERVISMAALRRVCCWRLPNRPASGY